MFKNVIVSNMDISPQVQPSFCRHKHTQDTLTSALFSLWISPCTSLRLLNGHKSLFICLGVWATLLRISAFSFPLPCVSVLWTVRSSLHTQGGTREQGLDVEKDNGPSTGRKLCHRLHTVSIQPVQWLLQVQDLADSRSGLQTGLKQSLSGNLHKRL